MVRIWLDLKQGEADFASAKDANRRFDLRGRAPVLAPSTPQGVTIRSGPPRLTKYYFYGSIFIFMSNKKPVQNPSPESASIEPVPVEDALHNLLDREDLYVFGHGTAEQETAAATLTDGFHLSQAHLWSTVIGLDSSHESPNAIEDAQKLIENWPHHNLKYVVTLGIERLKPDQTPHRRYLQSVVQYRVGHDDRDDQYSQRYVVDSRFVAGYFDVEARCLVPNPNFDPHYDPVLLETTADTDILHERRPFSPDDLLGRIAVGPQATVTPPQLAEGDDIPEVW